MKHLTNPAAMRKGEQFLIRKLPFWRTPYFFSYWLPPFLWVLAILGISGELGSYHNTLGLLDWVLSWFGVLSPKQLRDLNFLARKTGHALGYGVLYFLWFRAFQGHRGDSRLISFLLSLALTALVAVVDENHQGWVASRTGSFHDVILDVSGAVLGALLTFAFWTPRPKPSYMY